MKVIEDPKISEMVIKKDKNIKILGKGAFSYVYKAQSKKDKKKYAIKVVK